MKKNNSRRRDQRYRDKREKDSKKKNRDSDKYIGLNTIAQVVGAPKSHSFHSSIPVQPAKTVKEPLLVCPDCNERIQCIAEAISIANGEFVHFDCMIERIRKAENLKEGQSISYIGKGNFAIVEKDDEGKFHIVKTIPVEEEKAFNSVKEYVESLKI